MENEEIKVSVVIPVYNTEKYVREAVESIMNQTLRELEIIIINDGSTDNSLQVVEELAAADSRIQVYSQSNQGLSMARNAGITHAHGRYIYFMDSDDLLEKDAMELCYSKCEEKELDFVFFDAQSFFEEDIRNAPVLNYQRTDKLENKVYTGPEAINIQLQHKTYPIRLPERYPHSFFGRTAAPLLSGYCTRRSAIHDLTLSANPKNKLYPTIVLSPAHT